MRLSVRITSLSALILIVLGMRIHMNEDQKIRISKDRETELAEMLYEKRDTESADDFYTSLKETNDDFQAFLKFESGLIALPAVQGSDNSFYLNHLFDKSEGISGTLFFDAQCEKEDDMRIIYGHTVFSDSSLMFSPLHTLSDPDAFINNRIFSLSDCEETETFEIICVFVIDESDENAPDTRIRNFVSEEAKKEFLIKVRNHALVCTDDMQETEGKMIILQTCMEPDGPVRLCVLAREKGRVSDIEFIASLLYSKHERGRKDEINHNRYP